MRIDGSPRSPIRSARPRKAAVRDEAIDDAEVVEEAETAPQEATARRRSGGLPARQQDMVFPRARDRRTATAGQLPEHRRF
jgi:hypothetical protein